LSLREDFTPPLFEPTQIIGRLTAGASVETGLPKGIPVVAGWNDLNASVLGSGVVEPGQAFNITGTSEHIGGVSTEERTAPELVCGPFLSGRKLLYGVTSCGGGSLEWYRNALRRDLPELIALATAAQPGAGGLLFLPYLEGERSPIWDAAASGSLLGLRCSHTEADIVRAILEGVAFSLRQSLEIVGRHIELDPGPIMLSGGPARNALWNQIKSDVFGIPAVVADCVHAGALGAAMLGAVAVQEFASCEDAAQGMAGRGQYLEPNPRHNAAYTTQYKRYCELYPTLKNWFAEAGNGDISCHVSETLRF
jgi:sugar (pentulose or hexulose) kinase